jgi:hypothetical protein
VSGWGEQFVAANDRPRGPPPHQPLKRRLERKEAKA